MPLYPQSVVDVCKQTFQKSVVLCQQKRESSSETGFMILSRIPDSGCGCPAILVQPFFLGLCLFEGWHCSGIFTCVISTTKISCIPANGRSASLPLAVKPRNLKSGNCIAFGNQFYHVYMSFEFK